MKFILACVPELSEKEPAHSSISRLGATRIMPDGTLNPAPAFPYRSRAYYGNIEYAGDINPRTGAKGLGFLRHLAVFNGQLCTFSEAFKAFLENPILRQYSGLYLEAGALVVSEGLEYEAGGRGSVCVWRSRLEKEPSERRLAQYRPGEKFKLLPLPIFEF